MPKHDFYKSALLAFWSVVLTVFTAVLGSIPLNALRRSSKPSTYWSIGLLMTSVFALGGLYPMAITMFTLVCLTGLLAEFEKQGFRVFSACFLSVAVISVFTGFSFVGWALTSETSWYLELIKYVELALNKVQITLSNDMSVEKIVWQLPSVLVMLFSTSLAAALVFERKVLAWMGILVVRKEPLSLFKVPDHAIWIFMFAMAGAFLKTDIKVLEIISLNTFNILLLLYFFQGFAVVTRTLDFYRVGVFWRALLLAILVVQLFPLLSAVGVLDFWVGFRERMTKKKADSRSNF